MTVQGRILVVEDLPEWRKKLAGILRREGYDVREAVDYDEAISWLDSQIFDLAVIDIRLEDWDEENIQGMELVEEIRGREIQRDMSVIIVTAYGTVERAVKAFREYEVFYFLEKAKLNIEEYKRIVADAIAKAYTGMR